MIKGGDDTLAGLLAANAGAMLETLRASGTLSGQALGDAGDAVAHHYLVRALAQHRPDDALLSEEGKADPARLDNRRVWIVDPLDGTREYSEGRDDWAVHVALSVDGVATAGAVAMPSIGRTFVSGEVMLAPPAGPLSLIVSRTRPPKVAESVAAALGATLISRGSAGAKAMAVVMGEAHGYLHAGGQYEWDSAAPVAVAAAAGLHVSRLNGDALRYNQVDPLLPDLLICRPEVADAILKEVAAAG